MSRLAPHGQGEKKTRGGSSLNETAIVSRVCVNLFWHRGGDYVYRSAFRVYIASGRPEIIPLSISALKHSLVKGRVCKRARCRQGAEAESTLWIIVLRAFSPLRKHALSLCFILSHLAFKWVPLCSFSCQLSEECWEVREILGRWSIY